MLRACISLSKVVVSVLPSFDVLVAVADADASLDVEDGGGGGGGGSIAVAPLTPD